MFNYKKVAKLKAQNKKLEDLFAEGIHVLAIEFEGNTYGLYSYSALWKASSDRFETFITYLKDRRKEKNRVEEIKKIVRETLSLDKSAKEPGAEYVDAPTEPAWQTPEPRF